MRRQGRNIRDAQKAEQDAAARDFYSALGGDGKEANRLRMMERAQPGYTETRARQLTDDRETLYRQRLAANERRLTRSKDFYRETPDSRPVEPVTPTPLPEVQPDVKGRIQPGKPDEGGGFSGGDSQAKRRRVAPQRLTRALSGGDLSRLLGA